MLLKNIKLFIKENSFLSFMFFATQVIAVIIMMFAYGVYMNTNYDLTEIKDEMKWFNTSTKGEPIATKMPTSLLLDNFPEMFEDFPDVLSRVAVVGRVKTPIDTSTFRSEFSLKEKDGKLVYGLGKDDLIYFQPYAEGDWFTSDDLNNSSKEVIIPYKLRKYGEEYQTFYGEEYKVKAYEEKEVRESIDGMRELLFFPLEDIPEKANIRYISLVFKRPISMGEYKKICGKFEEYFGDWIILPPFKRMEIKDTNAYKSMQYSAIGIALLASLTVGIILRYILLKRNKMTAIYRITGKTHFGVAVMYFTEMLIYVVASIALGMGIFMKILKGILIKNYEYFEIIFENKGYQEFIKIYAGIVLVVAMLIIFLSNRKSPYEQLRALYK